MHNKLQIIYKHNKPYGIRDENGFLFFFADVPKFPNQEERYRQEVQAQFALADYLLFSLQARGLTSRAPDAGDSAASSGIVNALAESTSQTIGVTQRG